MRELTTSLLFLKSATKISGVNSRGSRLTHWVRAKKAANLVYECFLFLLLLFAAFLGHISLRVKISIGLIITLFGLAQASIFVYDALHMKTEVYYTCDDGYAFFFAETGKYVPCEVFDTYALSVEIGETRTDLEIGGKNEQ